VSIMTTREDTITAERPASANGDEATIRIPVTGMTCAACQARVQRTLQKQPGVVDAGVNLMMNNATVRYSPRAITPDQLVAAIRETGYGAELAPAEESAFDEQEEMVGVDRLSEEVERPLPHRGHCVLDAAVRRHHDDREVGVEFLGGAKDAEAVAFGKTQV